MSLLFVALAAAVLMPDTTIIQERIDRFDPASGAFLGSQTTWFGPDGRRLREEVTDSAGVKELVFLVLHDADGREAGAVYFEGNSKEPTREVYSYSLNGREKTAVYFYEPGVGSDRTVYELDGEGREVAKRYYRANGSQYGEEDVLWDGRGNQLGWDFRYTEREGGASFRYQYQAFDDADRWTRRSMFRDGSPLRLEARSLVMLDEEDGLVTPMPFLPGLVSTEGSETSPSFSADGQVMVFARYGDDWYRKNPFIAFRETGGWRVEALEGMGQVYNLTLSPDGKAIFFATNTEAGERALFRIELSGGEWSEPENLSEVHGVVGTYPSLTEAGDLFIFDAGGEAGAGIFLARKDGEGFRASEPVFVPEGGTTFDAFAEGLSGMLLVSRCVDDICESNGPNGIWELHLDDGVVMSAGKIQGLPYAWGVQPVEALGIMVFTDGEDILSVPLAVADRGRPSIHSSGESVGSPGEDANGYDFLMGSWEGVLEYLDYGDNETLVSLTTRLSCHRSDDGQALVLEFSYEEPNGRIVSDIERLFETEEGLNLGGLWQIVERSENPSAGVYRLELMQEGEDNGREASIRNVVEVEDETLTITKYVRYAGSAAEFQRNQYRLRRTGG
ncbi:MAG: hypothetical protein HKO65_05810 [Gemmatimonadetes bacterium]|nr:PD40 domain-containing protein [Gemmatimonadota bacterium]NNM04601.1 hypothetical protein [Gemmatimonadota bacterium]